jgi:hypothetical protein
MSSVVMVISWRVEGRAKKRSSGLSGRSGEGEKEVGGFGGVRGGADDGAGIVLQDGEPIADVVGMAHGRHDPERRTEKRAAHFGDEFFAGIGFAAESPREIAVEAMFGTAPVRLMPISA